MFNTTIHQTEAQAISHANALQADYERFAVVTMNYAESGTWLVTYELGGIRIDRRALKHEQSIV